MRSIKLNTIVKVRSDLEGGRKYGNLYFNNEMERFRGNEYKIIGRSYYSDLDDNIGYALEDTCGYCFSSQMLEEVSEDNIEEVLYCDDCHRLKLEEELTYIDDLGKWVCEDCLHDYEECSECGEMFRRSDLTTNAYGNLICDDCRSRHYLYCEDCGRYFYEEDLEYNDYNESYYCEDCYPRHELEGKIYGYHEFNDWTPFKANGEVNPPFYIGHELEVENFDGDTSCVDLLYEKLNVILAHDGSIDNGYEIISHPQTPRYIKEEKLEDYKEVFKTMIERGYRSHQTSTCGLHFHVTRPFYNEINNILPWNCTQEQLKERDNLIDKQNEIIDRIILVMETYKEELIKFSRRKSSEMHWCQFLSDFRNKPSGEIKSLYYVKKHKNTCTRYMALNLENSATIEFRLFKGTLNFDTFMASMELVNNIMTLCSDLSTPVTDITWDKLVDSEYARKYCEEKDIHSDKRVIDNSKEEIDLEEKIKKEVKKTYREIVKIYNAELKRVTSNLKLSLKSDIETMRTKLVDNNRTLFDLSDLTNTINNLLNRFNREEIDVDDLKIRIKNLITNNVYDARIIDWTLYEDIKNKLLEIVNN